MQTLAHEAWGLLDWTGYLMGVTIFVIFVVALIKVIRES